jgi:hypothetical protein
MDCFQHFIDQLLQTVIEYLPSLLDWLLRLKA